MWPIQDLNESEGIWLWFESHLRLNPIQDQSETNLGLIRVWLATDPKLSRICDWSKTLMSLMQNWFDSHLRLNLIQDRSETNLGLIRVWFGTDPKWSLICNWTKTESDVWPIQDLNESEGIWLWFESHLRLNPIQDRSETNLGLIRVWLATDPKLSLICDRSKTLMNLKVFHSKMESHLSLSLIQDQSESNLGLIRVWSQTY